MGIYLQIRGKPSHFSLVLSQAFIYGLPFTMGNQFYSAMFGRILMILSVSSEISTPIKLVKKLAPYYACAHVCATFAFGMSLSTNLAFF